MKDSIRKRRSWRLRFRFLFRILLAVGFVVQSFKLLEMYRRYPSMLQLNVEQPDHVEFPAFTVCNLNEVRATPFCEKYPKKCGNSLTVPDFCDKYAEYCRIVNDSSKVLPIVSVDEYNLSRYEQQLFGHQWENLVIRCYIQSDDNETQCEGTPILVPALSHSHSVPYNCFMMNSFYGQPDAVPKLVPTTTVIHLHLNPETSEYHPSHLSRGAQISIHSPYEVPSPTSEGFLLNLGTIYRFYLKLNHQNLLPAPYSSNCTDYMSEWKRNGGKGPITNYMCREKCKLDKSLAEYGCVHDKIDYPHNETMCKIEIPNFMKDARSECTGRCSMSCSGTRYEAQVQLANSEGNRRSCMNSTDLSCSILVQLFLENMEITTYTYTPLYETVGILSWIGGYVGLWLGISLLHVYDFTDKWASRCVVFLRKKLQKRAKAKKVFTRAQLLQQNYRDVYWSGRVTKSSDNFD